MTSNRIEGTIPRDFILGLTALQTFSACGNRFSGNFPTWWTTSLYPQLRATQTVTLGQCGVHYSSYCLPGYFNCTSESLTRTLIACPIGTTSTGSAGCYNCTAPPGSYCPIASASINGTQCGSGTWGPGGALPCIPCTSLLAGDGTYCAAGSRSDEGTPCPAGRTYTTNATANSSDCVPCPAGTYSQGTVSDGGLAPIQVATCVPCSAPGPGKQCIAASSSDVGVDCPAGQWSSGGSVPCSLCTSAAPGRYCPQGSASGTGVACPAGQWSPGGPETACTVCAQGKFSAATGSATCNGTVCPAGYACPPGSVAPSLCGTGQFSVGAVGACAACPKGVYGITDGLTTSLCTGPCPAGTYCPPSTAVPFLCPIAKYSSEGQGLCTPCALGYFSNSTGATTFECSGVCEAPAGSYCDQGALTPTGAPCAGGRYSSVPGMATAACLGPCAPGFECPAGSASPTGLPCSAGRYSTGGASVCTACPNGTFGTSTGGTSMLVACNGTCNAPLGNYCGPAMVSPDGAACPMGSTGGVSPGQCQACLPGTTSPGGVSPCIGLPVSPGERAGLLNMYQAWKTSLPTSWVSLQTDSIDPCSPSPLTGLVCTTSNSLNSSSIMYVEKLAVLASCPIPTHFNLAHIWIAARLCLRTCAALYPCVSSSTVL